MAERRKKGPGGRPPKPRAQKQQHRVALSLTKGEVRALRRAAGKVPVSTFARALVLAYLAREERSR